MPAWDEILEEVNSSRLTIDGIRRNYLKKLSDYTGRNVILYYSNFLGATVAANATLDFGINDTDKTGFMTCIHNMKTDKGLDIILHTPGGDIPATESLVYYLKSIFGNNIRAIVPQIAMSAGTMIALSCSEILMGKQSNLGPIDPQYGPYRAHGIIEEFNNAVDCAAKGKPDFQAWQYILNKYTPTLIGECQKSITWSDSLVKEWLKQNMFAGQGDAETKADAIVKYLGSHSLTYSHSRHIHIDDLLKLGVKVVKMESDQTLQDLILSVHHSTMITFNRTKAYKIIENQEGKAFVLASV